VGFRSDLLTVAIGTCFSRQLKSELRRGTSKGSLQSTAPPPCWLSLAYSLCHSLCCDYRQDGIPVKLCTADWLTQGTNEDKISPSQKQGEIQLMVRPRHNRPSPLRRRAIRRIIYDLQLALLCTVTMIIALTIFAVWRKESPHIALATSTPTATRVAHTTSSPALQPTPTSVAPQPTPTQRRKRIGILAGHSGPQNDPGAVCPDGLREVDINLAVAKRVVAALRSRGYEVDLLEEFDDRLRGYRADAFLSIHADACDIPEATGFKVAHVSFSAIPAIEDQLVDCLYKEYERATGLHRHDFSITPDMHEYHAFLEIDPQTPGAIIELGFMAADRYILVNQPDRLAAGIVAGLLCFLEQNSASGP